MKPFLDRLAQAKARPQRIEEAVRIALRDATAWRCGGGTAPNADSFAAAAVACARQALDAIAANSTERSRTLATVQYVAKRFSASALGRRLMAVPSSQFVRLVGSSDGPDVIVRDRRHRLHAIVLKVTSDALDAGRSATAVASATQLSAADRLSPLTVHVFCLMTGERQTFLREVPNASSRTRVA